MLKSIEKDPAHRYRTASALGEDLRRFLAREPILARPPRLWERLLKWARRQPGLAALAASLVLVTALALAGLTALWLAAERANVLARRSSNAERRAHYRADITAAAAALQLNHTETARRLLDASPPELRNWEWRYLAGELDNSLAAFEPPNARSSIVSLGPGCSQVIYSAAREPVLHIRDLIAGREIAELHAHVAEVQSIAWSKDGRVLASSSADGALRLWDAATRQPLAALRDRATPVLKMYFSDDASRLVLHTSGPDAEIWHVPRRALLSTLSGVNDSNVVKLSPDGKRLAVGRSRRVELWDVDSGAKLAPLSCGIAQVTALAFSSDGTRLAAGTDYPENRVWLWETAANRLRATMDGHTNIVCSLEFSPDSRRLVSTSFDQSVRLWDCATGQSISTLQGHTAAVTSASFHPDGRHLISASRDGSLRLWDTHDRTLIAVFRGESHVERFALSSPDGSLLAAVGSTGAVHVWDFEHVKNAGVLGRHNGFVYDVAFSPAGRPVASAGWDGAVRLWDAHSGRALGVLDHHPIEIVTALAFDSGGRKLASMARDRRINLWDLATTERTTSPPLGGGSFAEHRIAFAPHGDLAAVTIGDRGTVQLFTTSGRSPPVDLVHPGSVANDIAFSPDGSRLVCAYADGTLTNLGCRPALPAGRTPRPRRLRCPGSLQLRRPQDRVGVVRPHSDGSGTQVHSLASPYSDTVASSSPWLSTPTDPGWPPAATTTSSGSGIPPRLTKSSSSAAIRLTCTPWHSVPTEPCSPPAPEISRSASGTPGHPSGVKSACHGHRPKTHDLASAARIRLQARRVLPRPMLVFSYVHC